MFNAILLYYEMNLTYKFVYETYCFIKTFASKIVFGPIFYVVEEGFLDLEKE